MGNELFCGSKAQLSALIVSASKIGSIIGTVAAGIIPNKYGRKRPVQAVVISHLVFYIMMIFTNNLSDYGIAFTLCEMCSAFIWTTLSVYGVEVSSVVSGVSPLTIISNSERYINLIEASFRLHDRTL